MKLQEFIIQEHLYKKTKDNHIISEAFKITPDFETILEILWKKCNPFLKDLLKPSWNGDFLYSGRGEHKDVIMIKKVRDNRIPSDMNEELSEIFDDVFYDKFGFNARSNAIFCTGDYNEAMRYGNVYLIFPVGKYKFIYSKTIKDLYTETVGIGDLDKETWVLNKLDDYKEELEENLRRDWENTYNNPDYGNGHWEYHSFDTDIEDIPYKSHYKAIKYVQDVLDENDEDEEFDETYLEWVPDEEWEDYLDMRYDDELMNYRERIEDDFEDYIRGEIESVVDSYIDDSIINAIRSKNEIMLNAKYYIALNADKYLDALRSYYRQFGYSEPRNIKIKKWYKQNKGRIPRQLSLFRGSK
jgi:hypothetical protein